MQASRPELLHNNEPSSEPLSQPSGQPSELPNTLPIIEQAGDEELQNECNRLCCNQAFEKHDAGARQKIALKLVSYLLEKNKINFTWRFSSPYPGKASLMDYFSEFDLSTIALLAERGFDLNPIVHSGVASFTFRVGNAQNDYVDFLLDVAERYQTQVQRSAWINKKDEMVRFEFPDSYLSCCGLFSPSARVTQVQQTPLQLMIAKGYKYVDGNGYEMKVSNLSLAAKLLRLGAIDEVDYQEPAKGNSALHIACARRDIEAVTLLIGNGASVSIRNHDNKKPMDMLDISFESACALMRFHTSPDGHPGTFCLDKMVFSDQENLAMLRELGREVDAQLATHGI